MTEPSMKIDWIMEDRIYRAFEDIHDEIDAERITFDEAKRALQHNWDLGDFFQEWWDEGLE